MRRLPARAGVLLTAAGLAAACATASGTAPPTAGTGGAPDPAAVTAAAPPPVPVYHAPVRAAGGRTGRVLVDGDGRTLYYFDRDVDGVPSCYGECAESWRPYLTRGAPDAGAGADRDLLGTAGRADGATQVAYAGRPLYHHARDTGPGEVTGDGVTGFGGTWHAVTPEGRPA